MKDILDVDWVPEMLKQMNKEHLHHRWATHLTAYCLYWTSLPYRAFYIKCSANKHYSIFQRSKQDREGTEEGRGHWVTVSCKCYRGKVAWSRWRRRWAATTGIQTCQNPWATTGSRVTVQCTTTVSNILFNCCSINHCDSHKCLCCKMSGGEGQAIERHFSARHVFILDKSFLHRYCKGCLTDWLLEEVWIKQSATTPKNHVVLEIYDHHVSISYEWSIDGCWEWQIEQNFWIWPSGWLLQNQI